MRNQQAAYRYAKSLMDLALERGQMEQVRTDVKLMLDTCAASSDLRVLLKSPVIRADQKQRALNKIFGGQVGEIAQHFFTVVTRKGREQLIPEIARAFEELYLEQKNIVICQITSAVKLTPVELEKVRKITSLRYPGKTIEMREMVDPSILGGGIIQIGDLQWDASLRNKLHVIRRTFAENPYIPKF
ncbi:MAG: ATP synthase F1 subunit delta [Flavobacteriales bacterium]|nr:ATP synthase F1 subunit delta [Flavobacteriales bacterium]